MLVALLHGKLSRDQENMEDILTSNVFGVMRYLPPAIALFPFISKASSPEGVKPLAALSVDMRAEMVSGRGYMSRVALAASPTFL